MASEQGTATISRRSFLKGLGALALMAIPACRKAQQFAVEPEECPEWMLPGEATCFVTCMPWASGAIPMLAVCHDGLPVALQPNPQYESVRRGLPAFAQASILDLYDAARPEGPTRAAKPHPMQAFRASVRAWASLLRSGGRMGFLFPAGYSAIRMAQVQELRQFNGASFYEYDPAAAPRTSGFPELAAVQDAAFGPAVQFDTGFGNLTQLTRDLAQLDTLFIFTPADPAAFDADFARALENTSAECIRFVQRKPDKTAQLCLYTVPQTHFLEEWGAEADAHGNLCLRQPVTHALRPALAEAELLHALLHEGELPDAERKNVSPVRRWLEKLLPDADAALRKGVVNAAAPVPQALTPLSPQEVNFYLHPYYADGLFNHNHWLRETYFPLSGWAGEAEAFVDGQGKACGVSVGNHLLPAWAHPGVPGVWLPLMPAYLQATMAAVKQGSAPSHPYSEAAKQPAARQSAPAVHTEGASPQWGMLIDLARCIGCGACTLACRAENNIPTVGAAEQKYGRDLQWLRVARYLDSAHRLHYVPTACRQCEKAPCEAVCPVNATVHTSTGLSAMVYPRCWGTRYCAAACPYNARVFNFRDYAEQERKKSPRPHNPQVTLRSRGVMEKCTYCVQRINAAKNKGNTTPQTACQQACPTGAIKLVNLCDTALPRVVNTAYDTDGTRPRTLYY